MTQSALQRKEAAETTEERVKGLQIERERRRQRLLDEVEKRPCQSVNPTAWVWPHANMSLARYNLVYSAAKYHLERLHTLSTPVARASPESRRLF